MDGKCLSSVATLLKYNCLGTFPSILPGRVIYVDDDQDDALQVPVEDSNAQTLTSKDCSPQAPVPESRPTAHEPSSSPPPNTPPESHLPLERNMFVPDLYFKSILIRKVSNWQIVLLTNCFCSNEVYLGFALLAVTFDVCLFSFNQKMIATFGSLSDRESTSRSYLRFLLTVGSCTTLCFYLVAMGDRHHRDCVN